MKDSIYSKGDGLMECEKCGSKNIEVIKIKDRFNQCPYTHEQWLSKYMILKCSDCNHEFEEGDFDFVS